MAILAVLDQSADFDRRFDGALLITTAMADLAYMRQFFK